MADDDDDNPDDDERKPPPVLSRLGRSADRRYRTSPRYGNRDRFQRLRKTIPIAELIGKLIEHHGLTDEVRGRCVCIYWPEIVGERIASKTFPVAFVEGVLQVSTGTSAWVQELHYFKAQLVAKVNDWVDANRIWLGPPPLVHDMRFALEMKQRQPLVDRDHVRRLRRYHARRVRPLAEVIPPVASEAEQATIRAETSSIVDPELRAVILGVRLKWNR